jgi:hypothetical protein
MAYSMHRAEVMPAVREGSPDGPKPPLDFSHHFSRVTKARKESSIKEFYKYFLIPGIGNLAGGKLRPLLFCHFASFLSLYIIASGDTGLAQDFHSVAPNHKYS